MSRRCPEHYTVLGVTSTCDFATLKRAYYRRAKECHPDLFPGRPEKEEEFKALVQAFDVLSDPIRRDAFDASRQEAGARPTGGHYGDDPEAVMDSLADDALEELIVGNTFPRNTTLRTLMRDLEQTDRFVRYREARNCLHDGKFQAARELFTEVVRRSPGNILFHYYLAVCCRRCGDMRRAVRHLRICLQLGSARNPPQRLERMSIELTACLEQSGGFAAVIIRLLRRSATGPRAGLTDDGVRVMVNREIHRLSRLRRGRRRLGS